MRAARAAALGLAAAALTGACHEPSYGGPEYEVRPATDAPWSGSRLDLFCDGFRPPAEPHFRVDARLLPASRRNDTTYTVSLPDIPSQSITIDVLFADDTASVGPMYLHGFRDSYHGPMLKGTPRPWPGAGTTTIVVADTAGVVRYDVTHNLVVQRWPDSLHRSTCSYGPGASFRPGHFVLQGLGCDQLKSWRLLPGAPGVADSTGGCGSPLQDAWAVVEMSAGRWLTSRDGKYFVIENTGGTCSSRELLGYQTQDAVLSPRRDRLVVTGYRFWDPRRPVVLDAATAEAAFSIPVLYDVHAATFSTDGDTIFVEGVTEFRGSDHYILALDATTGTMLDSITIPEHVAPGWPTAAAPDPLADALYVAGYTEGLATLLVYRRSTLELLTTLRAAPSAVLGHGEVAVIPAPLEGLVYVLSVPLTVFRPDWPIAVYRFDRAP